MGHEILKVTYSEKTSKEVIFNDLNNRAIEDGDYHTGIGGIRWLDNVVCFDYEEAEEKITALDRGWYDCLAVKYKDYSKIQKSKNLTNLEKRMFELLNKHNNLKSKPHFANVKSAYIGCKNCGSKLNSKYLKHGNKCLVCGADLRPETVLNKIEHALEAWQKARNEFRQAEKEYQKKLEAKAEIRWLVKVEYHV